MLLGRLTYEGFAWAKHVPLTDESVIIELCQVFEMEDFPADVQAAAQ